ncbi:hypothetical protein RVX_R09940 [Nitratidesulfovibrio sp. HK-II]|uniref:hypothetical protein n=1 Tax=Nitratidesulfovibrio sp. HK-II TaxID=2009266 RepID=UPI000E2EE6FF|nr:hypothetical protein [Nitratidesulfovibrio sp. HK-II]GBO95281.1 hypothetical protein RVX_0322 [Nitratidesulfovibrio sp. HK-II]
MKGPMPDPVTCTFCGRSFDASPEQQERELRTLCDDHFCLDCACHADPAILAAVGEDRLLDIIENWYG